jgi:hypothetical protein
VSHTIPLATKVAWQLNKRELKQVRPGTTKRRFVHHLSRASYRREWGRAHQEPGALARFLAFLFRLVPKFGFLHGLRLAPPTPRTEALFIKSFNDTIARVQSAEPKRPPDRDYDTGRLTKLREYALADKTYAKLARTLAEKDFRASVPRCETTFRSPLRRGRLPGSFS